MYLLTSNFSLNKRYKRGQSIKLLEQASATIEMLVK